MSDRLRKKIAVVGAGAGGLASAFLLGKQHDVVLFEAGDDLGGHAHAESVTDAFGKTFNVDTAFLIFNDRTYENFVKFIDVLGVSGHVIPAEMSSCFSDPRSRFDYTLGNGWRPFLAGPRLVKTPSLVRIGMDFINFRKMAVHDLGSKKNFDGITVGDYLSGFSREFVENLILPLIAAIWSMPGRKMKDSPVLPLLQYFANHQLLEGRSERRWRTFCGSSRVYVQAFSKKFQGQIRMKCPVRKVMRTNRGVDVTTDNGIETFDHVVLSTHADTSLRILSQPTEIEKKLLSAWRYQDNPVVLHTDPCVLNPRKELWASWNIRKEASDYRISYYLNRLQRIDTTTPFLLTLQNDEFDEAFPIDPSRVIKKFSYRHPIFDSASLASQPDLPSLNDRGDIFFCGSYFGYGFHEDAIRSAVQIAGKFQIDWITPHA